MLDRGVRHFPVLGAGRPGAGRRVGRASCSRPSTGRRFRCAARSPGRRRRRRSRRCCATCRSIIVGAARRAGRLAHHLRPRSPWCWDAAVRRLLDLAVTDEGPPPCPFAWLALGSHARREPMPSSDIDSALAWIGDDEDPADARVRRKVARRVVDALQRGGIEPCATRRLRGQAGVRTLAGLLAERGGALAARPGMEQALMLVVRRGGGAAGLGHARGRADGGGVPRRPPAPAAAARAGPAGADAPAADRVPARPRRRALGRARGPARPEARRPAADRRPGPVRGARSGRDVGVDARPAALGGDGRHAADRGRAHARVGVRPPHRPAARAPGGAGAGRRARRTTTSTRRRSTGSRAATSAMRSGRSRKVQRRIAGDLDLRLR